MKTTIITMLFLFSTPVLAGSPDILQELSDQGIDYISMRDAGHVKISVWGEEVDPRKVCEMGDKYTDVSISVVRNVQTNQTAYCGKPAI